MTNFTAQADVVFLVIVFAVILIFFSLFALWLSRDDSECEE